MLTTKPTGLHPLFLWMWAAASLSFVVMARAQSNALENITVPSMQSSQCNKNVPFDPKVHKPHYKVYVNAIRGVEVAYDEYYQTFQTYLTETVGKRFDPPVTFSVVADLMPGIYGTLENEAENVDFLFLNSAGYSCVEAEYGAQPLATSITKHEVRGLTWDLDVYAGVIFTRADNDDIQDMKDLKDKIIGAASVTVINAGQSQLVLMQRLGLDYIMDPKQVVFTNDQVTVVQRVMSGDFDVGFVRTEMLELFDADLFKVIKPKTFIMEDGMLFPLLHSTDMFPEFPVAVMPHVHADVSIKVQNALYAYQSHAAAGQQLVNDGLFAPERCDTTEDIAMIAYNASITGHLAGFCNPMSYAGVRSMLEEGKFMQMDNSGIWRCNHGGPGTLYDNIECPAEHQKLTRDDFVTSCLKAGLSCEDGWDCYCKPCRKSYDVDVFQCDFNHTFLNHNNDTKTGCSKMDLCGSGQQREPIQFCIIDNMRRLVSEVNVTIHVSGEQYQVPVVAVDQNMYKFNWSDSRIGIDLLEIVMDGGQILQSPIQVAIVERNCNLDYPGRGFQAAANGECFCSSHSLYVLGACVSTTIIVAITSIVFLIFAMIAGVYFIRYKNFMNDQLWMVKLEELHFDDPVEIIGQGSFGVVLKAEYRGTKVAIKKAIKYTRTCKSGASGTVSKCQGSVSLNDQNITSGSRDKVLTRGGTIDLTGSDSNEAGCKLRKLDAPEEDEDTTDEEVGQCVSASTSMSILQGALQVNGRDHHKWRFLGFKKKNDSYQKQFRESILGHSASLSRKSFSAQTFPWCNEKAQLEEALKAEMRVLVHLRHPSITTVLGAVISRTHEPMLVMELMEHGSLYDILRNNSLCLTGEIILQICKDIAQGLRYLHSSKPLVLHGDLKSRNILIDSRFRAKLCDFGLSNKFTNNITGTPFWMAPEYLTGLSSYNCPCDIYSAGIMLWEIYSRKNPYEGEPFREVLVKVCDRRVNKRPTIDASFPPKMVAIMKKCWSKDPASRPNAASFDLIFVEMTARDTAPLETKVINPDHGQKVYEDLFPAHIAAALRAGKKVEPEQHDLVTVFFSEIDGYSDISQAISPEKVCNLLGRLFNVLDELSKAHGVFKVETVGCNYMGVTNLNGSHRNTHVKKMAEFAIDMINAASKILVDQDLPELGFVKLRAGFHSGPVVSNVIGDLRPRYGLFGDTVNTASRMQSNSKPNRILCSEYAHILLREQAPELPTLKRGKIQVKGKGLMTLFWVGKGLISAGREKGQTKNQEFCI